jgi:alkylation response protein AidB-like acyl-CoA dehydrogenase
VVMKERRMEVVRLEEKMGHRGSSTASLRFNGCRVPGSNLLGYLAKGSRSYSRRSIGRVEASPPTRLG